MYSNTANVVAMLTCDSEQTTEADYEALAFHLGDRMNNLEDMQVAFNVPEETGNFIFEPDGLNILFLLAGELNGKPKYEAASPSSSSCIYDGTQWSLAVDVLGDGMQQPLIYLGLGDTATPTDDSIEWYDGATLNPVDLTLVNETSPATDDRAISGLRLQYIDEFQTDQDGVGVSLIVDEVAS
jgi:hypothetical protein